MFSKVSSAVISGVESRMISVEADVSDGLPGFYMVGYLASEVKEAQDRVRTAIRNSGLTMLPKKITVNLAPADLRKSGSGFDLPIAAAILSSYGYIPAEELKQYFIAGELGLDGNIRGIRGVLGMVMEARAAGMKYCIVPEVNIQEASVVRDIEVYGAAHLKEIVAHFATAEKLKKRHINIEEIVSGTAGLPDSEKAAPDFADVKGQHFVKRAAEIAAAGMHNLLITGPPGAGKSMIASRIPGILPPLSVDEALEITKIHSIAGLLPESGIMCSRPFRMPHHTVTAAALTGGGMIPKPGEISLAHRGVLYLDELPEFQKDTLEILRQPMEDGVVRISRNSGQFVFPADFMLIASRNPCKCGYYPDRSRCRCNEQEVLRYLNRISRPLLDRIDLHAEAYQMTYTDLQTSDKKEESSAQIRNRVRKAHRIQKIRYAGTKFRYNADLGAAVLETYCPVEAEEKELLQQIYEKKKLTARSYHRMLKVARTIADLAGSEQIRAEHIGEAVQYRMAEYL